MFGNKDKSDVSPRQVSGASARSHIAEGMLVKGDVEGDFDLLLDGRLEGNLRCRTVTVGKAGEVVGKIIAQEAIIEGRVEGDVEAKAVKLQASAEMIGDVRHEVIEVSSGARIEGRYGRMDGQPSVKKLAKSTSGRGIKSEKLAPPKAPASGPKTSEAPNLPEAAKISAAAAREGAGSGKLN